MVRLDRYIIMFTNLVEGMIYIPPRLLDCPNKTRLEEVSEHYTATRDMVSSGIFMVKVKNSKGSGSGDLNFRNQGTLNDETFGCWKSPMWIIFFQYGFPHVYIWYFGRIKQPKESERIQDSLQEQEFYLTRLY